MRLSVARDFSAMPLKVPGLFITGTDTGVGKTFITALIAEQVRGEGVRVGAYKPACSGAVETMEGTVWEDVEALWRATGDVFDRERIGPQRFPAPLAPPIAAREEGRSVDSELLRSGARWWESRCEFLLVEGAGGLLCPLTKEETVADLAADLGLPLVIVARATLGTINHTLLTIEAARARGLAIAGVLLNEAAPVAGDGSVATNGAEIERRSGVPVLGVVPHGASARLLTGTGGRKIEWRGLARVGRG